MSLVHIAALVLAAVAATLALYPDALLGLTLDGVSCVALVIGCAAYLAVVQCSGPWSVGSMVLFLVLLFHLGLMPFVVFDMPFDPDMQSFLAEWFDGPAVLEAVYLSTTAVAIYAAVYVLTYGRSPESVNTEECLSGATFARAGAVLVVGGGATYLGYVVLVAPNLLFGAGRYGEYVNVVGGDRLLGLSTLAIVLGLILAAPAPAGRPRQVALLTFLAFAVLLLLVGVRTAVLFPAAAGVVAAARRHRLPSGAKATAVILLGLMLVSVVREIRTLDSHEFSRAALNPLSALAETGSSLRPVVETIEADQPSQYGASYLIPFERLVDRALDRANGSSDITPAELMEAQAPGYQIGYSVVAEAYLNFGRNGPMVLFALLGAALALVDRARRTGLVAACMAGVVMAAIGLTVRNTFISLPSTLIAGTMVVLVVKAAAQRVRR